KMSVIRSSLPPNVTQPFLKRKAYSEIKDAVGEVKFTGQNTRIDGAVGIALDEMVRARRPDVLQVRW
ncbi:hypothetical protein Angca_000680, partial [Angiostrongylus cantonensis]